MPASYPGSVKVFATRSAGQTIASAHINDLQDEVHAIEDGLLNGSAQLNSSRMTGASLDIAGASTLHGDVTISSTLTLSGALITTPVACRVFSSSNTSVSNAGRIIPFNSDSYQLGGTMHSTSVNPTRLTVVSSGVHLIAATVELSASSAGSYRQIQLLLNSTFVIAAQSIPPSANAGGQIHQLTVATANYLQVGDFVEVRINHDAGTDLTITAVSQYAPYFMMTKAR